MTPPSTHNSGYNVGVILDSSLPYPNTYISLHPSAHILHLSLTLSPTATSVSWLITSCPLLPLSPPPTHSPHCSQVTSQIGLLDPVIPLHEPVQWLPVALKTTPQTLSGAHRPWMIDPCLSPALSPLHTQLAGFDRSYKTSWFPPQGLYSLGLEPTSHSSSHGQIFPRLCLASRMPS